MVLKLVKKKKNKPLSLRNFYQIRNKILIKRRCGGIGDQLMIRMLFEDFSKLNLNIFFTCPIHYIEFAKNHPYCTAIPLNEIKEEEYGQIYDITTACRVHESKFRENNTKHRSDIWAEHCGVKLINHNMHLTPQEINITLPNKVALLATKSTDDEFGQNKSLGDEQIIVLVNKLKEKGFYPVAIHNEKQSIYEELGVEQLVNLHPQVWIKLVSMVDLIISIDTATFHLAGGMGKPVIGIFTHTSGRVYGKYYPTAKIIQGKCDFGFENGCFNCFNCPIKNTIKPCNKNLEIINV